MPNPDIDYSNTIIYKITCNDPEIKDVYVGHTTNFVQRKSSHKQGCINPKSSNYDCKLYNTIREKGGWDTWEIIPLEEYVDCQNKIQARIREEKWRLELNASLNMKKAHLSKEEYDKRHCEESKIFYQKNKDKIQIYKAQFFQDHKEEIKAKVSQKFECDCGSICRIGDKARHEKSKKHQAYLEK